MISVITFGKHSVSPGLHCGNDVAVNARSKSREEGKEKMKNKLENNLWLHLHLGFEFINGNHRTPTNQSNVH